MDKRNRTRRGLAAGAVVLGLVAGSYGVTAAASGNGSSSDGTNDAVGSGSSRSSEPLGSPAERRDPADRRKRSKVKAAALAEVPDATIVRIETDADGHAAYEAHVVKADGAPATVYVDKQFDGVRVESRRARGGARRADGGPCLTRAVRCARPPRRPRRGGRWARRAR